MYNLYKKETLVTIATQIKSNLALQFEDDFFSADSLCVVHDGYINFIPLKNKSRKCKYIPVSKDDRGTGKVKEIKWIKIENEVYFITLSSLGLHIYDDDLNNIKFFYAFEDYSKDICSPIGSCICQDILYVGVDNEKVYAFQYKRKTFELINETSCIFTSFSGLANSFIVTDYLDAVSLWTTDKYGSLKLMEKSMEGSLYGTTVLKIFPGFVAIGYTVGLLILLEVPTLHALTKTMAHQSDITDVDYCQAKNLLLTVSKDSFVKVFKAEDRGFHLECLWSMENPEKFPYCGCGFLDSEATEFCTIMSDETIVQIYREDMDEEKSALRENIFYSAFESSDKE